MSKRILVLEPSVTTQSILAEKTRGSDFELVFDTNGIRFLVTLYNSLPDAVLINARNLNPACAESVRLIKSVARFKGIPVGVFATNEFIFKDEFKKMCGADAFIIFDPESFAAELEALCAKKNESLSLPERNDIIKSGIMNELFSMIERLDSIKEIALEFLNLAADFAEVPAAALCLNLDGGAEGFFVAADNFTQAESADFIKVCASDFENLFPNANLSSFSPERLECKSDLSRRHSQGIPLSAYQMFTLENGYGQAFATIHVVKEGAFTRHQLDLLSYSAERLGLILRSAVHFREKIKFERNVRKAFSRFVPEQIIDELVNEAESDAKSGVGEKRDVAILFSDIRSFTSISERNKPETIVAFLNRYFTLMCAIIKKHGGTIDKFIGDAIMALFGAPVSYEDNARRAVAAACEMREALSSVPLEDLVLPKGMSFNIGIGIHYGDVIVGSIGSSDKTDYSVIGDNVNLASRLEGLTKKYGAMVLVSQATKDDIKDGGFCFRALDNVKVKGKEKAVPIYAIDRSEDEFSAEYKDAYAKGFALYKEGTWNLAREYFEKALAASPDDKAARLMKGRCEDFAQNPPQNWDGAIAFETK